MLNGVYTFGLAGERFISLILQFQLGRIFVLVISRGGLGEDHSVERVYAVGSTGLYRGCDEANVFLGSGMFAALAVTTIKLGRENEKACSLGNRLS